MAVSGVVGWLNIRHLAIDLRIPDEIYRDIPTQLVIRISNQRRWLPSFLLRVIICGETLAVPYLPGSAPLSRQLVHTFGQRGMVPVGPAFVVSPFPINFFVRASQLPLTAGVLVFPPPRRLSHPGAAERHRHQGASLSPQRGVDGETVAIGDYTGREPLKLVHWRLSAKHPDLKVKHGAQPAGEPLTIDLAALPGTLEERLAGATYLVNRLIRLGRPVGLLLDGRNIPPEMSRQHRLRLLKELAVYGQD
jgi:uncharacterized protein (DUF58 family)